MEEKQYISRIKLADGNIVDVKDQEARSSLEAIAALTGQHSSSIAALESRDNELAALIQGNSDKFDALNTTVNTNTGAINTLQKAVGELIQPKPSEEIDVGADGTLGINEMNVNKLVQTAGDIVILDGGTAV